MKNYYAKQFQAGSEIKVHTFKPMQTSDLRVQEQYDELGAGIALQ